MRGFHQLETLQFVDVPGPKSADDECLSNIQGTVILHFSFAFKQDPELGRQLLKLMKVESGLIKPFSLALLFALCRAGRFEQLVNEFLKSLVSHSFSLKARLESSSWVRSHEALLPGCDMPQLLVETLRCGSCGLDHILPAFIQFGLLLIETKSSKQAQAEFLDLGCTLVLEIFRHHEVVRSEILDQLLQRLLLKGQSDGIVRILNTIIKSNLLLALEHTHRFRELIECVSQLPPTSAVAVLQAMEPLFCAKPDLLDHLMLVLRKSLFCTEANIRSVAVDGLLFLMMFAKRDVPSVKEHQAPLREQISLEVLGLLRRCLSQSVESRERLYDGLVSSVQLHDELAEPALELLLSHLGRWCEHDASRSPPLHVEKCIGMEHSAVRYVTHGSSARQICLCQVALFCAYAQVDRTAGSSAVDDSSLHAHLKLFSLGKACT